MKRICVATDFSPGADAAVQRAVQMANEHQAELKLLHALGEPGLEVVRMMLGEKASALTDGLQRSAEEQLRAVAAGIDRPVETKVVSGRPSKVISAELAEGGDDVIVIGARGERPMRGLWLGSTAERVMYRAKRPALAVKNPPQGDYVRVLVPVDLSPFSAPAVKLAMGMCPHADIVALHAYHVPFEGKLRLSGATEEGIDGYREHQRALAEREMESLLDRLGRPERVRAAVIHGDAPAVILEQEQALGADLIVIGRQGRSTLGEILLGGVTRRILADSKADVLVSVVADSDEK
jgi:nucleotide-binding universal stress UspA family protein